MAVSKKKLLPPGMSSLHGNSKHFKGKSRKIHMHFLGYFLALIKSTFKMKFECKTQNHDHFLKALY